MESEDRDYLNLKYENQLICYLKKDGISLSFIHYYRENNVFIWGFKGQILFL